VVWRQGRRGAKGAVHAQELAPRPWPHPATWCPERGAPEADPLAWDPLRRAGHARRGMGDSEGERSQERQPAHSHTSHTSHNSYNSQNSHNAAAEGPPARAPESHAGTSPEAAALPAGRPGEPTTLLWDPLRPRDQRGHPRTGGQKEPWRPRFSRRCTECAKGSPQWGGLPVTVWWCPGGSPQGHTGESPAEGRPQQCCCCTGSPFAGGHAAGGGAAVAGGDARGPAEAQRCGEARDAASVVSVASCDSWDRGADEDGGLGQGGRGWGGLGEGEEGAGGREGRGEFGAEGAR